MDFTQGLNSIETFYGMVETTSDAFRIFDLCRRGKLGRIRRRLHDRERRLIRSGSIFCFDEVESGIRRWTDGRLWSPSRILGNFLIYRELDRKVTNSGVVEENNNNNANPLLSNMVLADRELSWLEQPVAGSILSSSSLEEEELPSSMGISPLSVFGNTLPDQSFPTLSIEGSSSPSSTSSNTTSNRKDRLEASWKSMASTAFMDSRVSLKPSAYQFKADGLIKKTISARVDGRLQHLVCYYSKQDFCEPATSSLQRLPQMLELRSWPVPIDLMIAQNFRKPPLADEPQNNQPIAPQQILSQPAPLPLTTPASGGMERRKRRNTAPVLTSNTALGKHALLLDESNLISRDCGSLQLTDNQQGDKELMELVGMTQPSSDLLLLPSVFQDDPMLATTNHPDDTKSDLQVDEDFLNSLKVSVDDNSIFL